MKTTKDTPTFRSLIEQLMRRHDAYKVFAAFTHMTACALAHGTREPEYLDEAKRWEQHELEIFSHALGALVMEMEARPFTDLLGGHYMDLALSHKGQQWNGEFHTPQPICELMARVIAGDTPPPDEGPIRLCEPACGAGAMILAYAQALPTDARRRLRVTAIDISKVACDMCFINTTLWGIPTEVIHGDTLRMEFRASWRNIHWIFRGNLHLLAGLATSGHAETADAPVADPAATLPNVLSGAIASASQGQGQPPSKEKAEQIKVALGQQLMDFS